MIALNEDKEDHASVVQLDPEGMVASVLEVEKMYEKCTSAETFCLS